jgi:type VI protein secretion system component VasA
MLGAPPQTPESPDDAPPATMRDALEALGPAIAHVHPQLARHIAHPGGDPDVARLLEGIAHLGAVLEMRAEACAPALTGQLAASMAPALTRPQPAVALCALALPLQGRVPPIAPSRR